MHMNENVKIFIIATLVIAFVLFLPSLIESAKLLSPEAGFADEKAAEEILDDKSNNETQPILEDDEKEEDGVSYGSLKESFSNPYKGGHQLVIRVQKGV